MRQANDLLRLAVLLVSACPHIALVAGDTPAPGGRGDDEAPDYFIHLDGSSPEFADHEVTWVVYERASGRAGVRHSSTERFFLDAVGMSATDAAAMARYIDSALAAVDKLQVHQQTRLCSNLHPSMTLDDAAAALHQSENEVEAEKRRWAEQPPQDLSVEGRAQLAAYVSDSRESLGIARIDHHGAMRAQGVTAEDAIERVCGATWSEGASSPEAKAPKRLPTRRACSSRPLSELRA